MRPETGGPGASDQESSQPIIDRLVTRGGKYSLPSLLLRPALFELLSVTGAVVTHIHCEHQEILEDTRLAVSGDSEAESDGQLMSAVSMQSTMRQPHDNGAGLHLPRPPPIAHGVSNGSRTVYGDGSWQLSIFVTDLQVERSLRVRGDTHIGGVMIQLVDSLGECKSLQRYCFQMFSQMLVTSNIKN